MYLVFIEPSKYSKETFGLKNRRKCSQIITTTISYRSICYAFYESIIFIKNYIPERILQRQFRLYIPFLGIARPQPQCPHSCVCERFIYSQDWSTYFLQQKRQTHRGNI
jgi:hypothetical protein